MGFWDNIRDSINEANEGNKANYRSTCERCGK